MRWERFHTIWAVMICGWIASYMVRSGLSPLLVPIMGEFGLSYAQAGLLATAFFYAYTAMQLPAGHLGDRFGRRIVLLCCSCVWTLGSLLTAFARSFESLFLFRFLTGIGQGAYMSNDRSVIAAYTPPASRGFGQGVSFVGLGTGMFVGISLSGVISDLWGWRAVFILYAIPSGIAALLIYIFIKEPPERRLGTERDKHIAYTLIFKSRDLWFLYLGGISGIYALWVVGTWAPAMFVEMGVTSVARSSLYASLLGLSAIPGLIITGMVSDRLVRKGKGRKGLVGIQFFLMALCLLLLGLGLETRTNFHLFVSLYFMTGFFIWGHWAAFYALLPDIVPYEILGSAYGLGNTIHFIGSLIAPWATGWIKDTTASFSSGLYLAAAFSAAGSILIFGVRPAFRFKPELPIGRRSGES